MFVHKLFQIIVLPLEQAPVCVERRIGIVGISVEPDVDPPASKKRFGRRDAMLREVKEIRCRYGRGARFLEDLEEMLRLAGAADGNHRYRQCVTDLRNQLQVKAELRAVAIDGIDQDFPGAEIDALLGEMDRVATGRDAPGMRQTS